nr:VOC family protein [Pseudomonadota bacterium]
MKILLNIDVDDLAAAETFYTTAFGLAIGRRLGGDAVELLGADAPIYLLQKNADTIGAAQSKRDYGRHWSPLHCDIVVDALDTAVARAVAAGAVQE